jgi:hypothetical protein
MGDSQYWTSLWVLGLFILLSLVCLSLAASVIAFLYDRISTYEIWKSPIWLKLKAPLIIVGVIGFLSAVIAYSRHEGRKEMTTARDYAEAQGWGFSSDAAEGFKAEVAKTLSDYQFDLYYIRTVETGWRSAYLFDCSYKNRDASGRKNYSYGTACLVRSNRFRSVEVPVEISTRDWTEVMIPDKVEMGESPFAREFIVQSRDPVSAKMIVNGSIQGVLLERRDNPLSNPVSVIIGPGGAVVLSARTAEPERLQELLELARKLESAVK